MTTTQIRTVQTEGEGSPFAFILYIFVYKNTKIFRCIHVCILVYKYSCIIVYKYTCIYLDEVRLNIDLLFLNICGIIGG